MARASFHTKTPFSRRAWRMPRRIVTAWNVPPDMVRTSTASGRQFPIPSMASPPERCVSIAHARKSTGRVRTPSAANACASIRACQSMPSTTRATSGARAAAGSAANASSKRGIEQLQIEVAAMEALAGLDGRNYHLGRTEQHRVNGVEVALETLEDLRKGLAVIAGAFAR